MALRTDKGTSQAVIDRSNQQNTARVEAIAGAVPDEASSADLVNSLSTQRDALATQQQTAATQARQGTLQNVGGTTDSVPTQAGATLRDAIDQTRAPAAQAADDAIAQQQEATHAAMQQLGGALPADADPRTAGQVYGQRFRAVLDAAAQDSKTNVGRLYDAIDPDGSLMVNMKPARQAAQDIVSALPKNAAPLEGGEKAIFDTAAALPGVQSYRELGALNSRVTTAMRAARSDPAQAQSYARLSQLRSGLADILQSSVEDQAGQDAAAVQAGTMTDDDGMLARIRASLVNDTQAWKSARANGQAALYGTDGGGVSRPGGGLGSRGPGAVSGAFGTEVSSGGRLPPASGSASLPPDPPSTANLDQDAADRITAANSAYAEHKATFGLKAPGVGSALAPGQTAGTFKTLDSSVPAAIFFRGAGAAERVQSAIQAGLPPAQIADYAAYDPRRVAGTPDGGLDPQAAARWRQNNGEAFQALAKADPSIQGRFDTAQQQSARLSELQAQRAALDDAHQLRPGWGDAEVMQRVWQPGAKGADSVAKATSAAGNAPVASDAIANYAAYSLRRMAAPDGVLDPGKYATWAEAYDGALSARPDIKAQFDTAARRRRHWMLRQGSTLPP